MIECWKLKQTMFVNQENVLLARIIISRRKRLFESYHANDGAKLNFWYNSSNKIPLLLLDEIFLKPFLWKIA